jgi:hypothetical protein
LLALYLNGQLRTYKPLSGKIRTTTFPFLMGQMLPAQPEYNFKGVMDAVKIYNYALVPEGVKNLFEEGVSGVLVPDFSETQMLELSPNPVAGVLSIRLHNIDRVTLSHSVNSRAQVRDLAGSLVLEEHGLSEEQIDLNVRTLGAGVYIVIFSTEKTTVMARFVKI